MQSPFSLWHWILVLGFFALIVYVVVIIVRSSRRQASTAESGGEPVGLGGWLILFLLFQLLSLMSAMVNTLGSLGVGPDGKTASPSYPELVIVLAWFVLLAATTFALLGKRRMFPRLWKIQVALFVPLAILGAVLYVWAPTGELLDQIATMGALVAAVVLAVSWRYMSVSRRVKNTFGATGLTVPSTVARRERFLKGFSIGFLLAALGTTLSIAKGNTAFTDGAVQCTLIGLLVGGGASLLGRRRQQATGDASPRS